MRLIDADDLLITDEECSKRSCVGCPMYVNSCEEFKGVIINAPTIEERKKGKWIYHNEVKNIYGGVCVECSECNEKYVVQYVEDEKFCRNCGAEMRGESDAVD